MNATAAIEQQKYGERQVNIGEWWALFDPHREEEQREYEDRLEDEYLDFLAEQERQYIADCRVDYGGI